MTSPLPLTETLTPTTRDAVAEAVVRAGERGTPLYPIGGGTSLGYGVLPKEPGLGLSMTGLNRLVDYPARDLTITVEAGMTVAAINRRLAAEGQRLPIDVCQPDRATIGGVVAVNAVGPRRYRWGTLRDYVIGLTAVSGRGELFSAGGRVVKNAAGYDLGRLLTGSFGTLGVIVQVTLMVRPLPEMSALVACGLPDLDAAERLLRGLTCTWTLPSAIELLAGPAWQNDRALESMEASAAWLVIGVEGTLAEVEWMVGQLQQEWRQAGVETPTTLIGHRAEPLWERMTEFRQPTAPGPGDVVLEIDVLPGDVVEAVRRVLEADPQASVTAHAGSGVVLVRSSGDHCLDFIARLRGAVARTPLAPREGNGSLAEREESGGRSLVVVGQPKGAAWGREIVWGPPRTGQAVMQAIKDRFDPRCVLNRGRFVFADGL